MSVRKDLRGIVRGSLPIWALEVMGVRWKEANRLFDPSVEVTPEPVDIALGFLAHKLNSTNLREWATFLLTASEIVDLSELEKWPDGDELLKGLWDASFDGVLNPSTEKIAKALVERSPSS